MSWCFSHLTFIIKHDRRGLPWSWLRRRGLYNIRRVLRWRCRREGPSAEAEWIRRAWVGVVHCGGAAPAVLRSALLHASSPGVWQAANGRRRTSGTRVQCVSAGSSLQRDGLVQTHTHCTTAALAYFTFSPM